MKKKNRAILPGLRLPLSIMVWGILILLTLLWSSLGVLIGFPLSLLFDPVKRRPMDWVSRMWGWCILRAAFPVWRFRIRGKRKIKKGKTYLIIANHQSLLDILLSLAVLPVNFKFMAKKELFNVPFLGWHIALADFIAVDRGNRESARRAFEKARRHLRNGISILMFPEGTRSPDGQIHEFKSGAFKLARELNIEILPVVIEGTGTAMAKHSRLLNQTSLLYLSVGEPVAMSGSPSSDFDTVRLRMHREMKARIERIRRRGL